MDSKVNARMVSSSYREFVRNARMCGMPGPALDDPAYFSRNIRRKGNHIYFYDEVDEETQLIFFQLMSDCIRENLSQVYFKGGADPIIVHVNSPGGGAHCGLAIYDFMKNCGCPITTVVEGCAASAASFIFLAGERRIVTKDSCVLLHQPSWGAIGQNRLLQDIAHNVEKIFDRMIKIYMAETTIGKDRETEEDRYAYIRSLCEHDYELDYDECKLLGISNASSAEPQLTEENEKKVEEYVLKLLDEQEVEELKKSKEKAGVKEEKPVEKKKPAKKEKSTEEKKKEKTFKKAFKKVTEEKKEETSKEEKTTK